MAKRYQFTIPGDKYASFRRRLRYRKMSYALEAILDGGDHILSVSESNKETVVAIMADMKLRNPTATKEPTK